MAKDKKPPWVVVVLVRNTSHVIGVVGLFATRAMALKWIDENGNAFANDYATAELMPGG